MATGADADKDLHEVKAVLEGLQRIATRLPRAEPAGKKSGDAAATRENPAGHEAVSQPPSRSTGRGPLPAGVPSGRAESADKRPVQGKRLAALALAMLAAGTVLVLAGDLFLKYWPGSSSSREAAPISGGITSAVATTERPGMKAFIPIPVGPAQPAPQDGKIDDWPASPVVPAVPANPALTNAHELMDGGRIVAAREMLQQPDLAGSQEGAWLLARSYDPNYLATIQSPDATPDKRQAEEWYRRWRDIAVRNGMVMDDLRLKRIINSMR